MPGTSEQSPRWVKVGGVVALVVVVVLAIVLVTGRGGDHGPGRHAPPADTARSGESGHRPPAGGHAQP